MITKLDVVGLAILAALFVVWPIPRTFSIRDSLLLLGCVAFIALTRRVHRQVPVSLGTTFYPTALLAALTLWMFMVALWISNEATWSLNEIRGQWLKALVSYALGLLIALSVSRNAALSTYVVLGIVTILLFHILYVDFAGVYAWLIGAIKMRAGGLTSGPDKSSYLTNILFAFLFAEVLIRWRRRIRWLPVSNVLLYAATIATVISVFAERARNGLLALTAMLIVMMFLAIRLGPSTQKRSYAFAFIAALVLGVSLALAAVSFKPRSNTLTVLATIPIATDTSTHKAWLDAHKYPFPILPNGKLVDKSAYLRVAWFTEGSKMLLENPLGRGFGRNAFGHGLQEKYGEGGGHSHSGLLDFAVGVGVPGTLLWLGFLVSLILIARRELDGERAAYAIALLFLVVDFSTRMMIDSIIRDHMLQMFLFLAGLLAVLTTTRGTAGTPADAVKR
jgi:hypothetical protein